MKKIIIFGLILFFSLISGCLWYEVVEYNIHFNENLNSGSIIIRYSNIQSTENDTSKMREDFQELLDMVNGDKFLLDGLEEGIYIQERKIAEENGQLIAYEKGIFRNLKFDNEQLAIKGDERILTFNNEDKDKIECNGKMINLENNTLLVWPKDQRDLYIKVISSKPDSLSALLPYYREWKKAK